MIDILQVEKYRENNRIEAKKATGGFPGSVWETYSAFSNTMGGVILLGVEEFRDKTFHVRDLPDPDGLVKELWRGLNDRRVVSANILSDGDIRVDEVQGKRIVVITVPRAPRFIRPVYIGTDPMTGTYRRNGEGDYRCTPAEIAAMQADAAREAADMQPLTLGTQALDAHSVEQYHTDFLSLRRNHPWALLSVEELLVRIGALCKDENGEKRLTLAGLLMFGRVEAIRTVLPDFSLSCEIMGCKRAGDGSDFGDNLYDFFTRVSHCMDRVFFALSEQNEVRVGLSAAFARVLANALVHADYRACEAITVCCNEKGIRVSNPGEFRVDPRLARDGGVSDPRNPALSRMFHFVRAEERVGGGIPTLFARWIDAGFVAPVIVESHNPDSVVLILPFARANSKQISPRLVGNSIFEKAKIIDLLTDRITMSCVELAEQAQLPTARIEELLQTLCLEGITIRDPAQRDCFRLRA